MVDLGPARRFLGMNIDKTETGFALYQTSYIESLLMTDAYGTEYLAIVGSLMYAALGTRSDISFAAICTASLIPIGPNPRTGNQ